MRDRQVFEQGVLPNGLRTYWYPHDARFTRITLVIPVGSAHSAGNHLQGTFHFLEHAVTLRSRLHPGYKEFDHLVGQRSGTFFASVDQTVTSFGLEVPSKYLDELLPGFYSALFEPLFEEADLIKERSVVATEREGKRAWFPGTDELSHYLATQWMDDSPLSLEQRLGSDADLAAMTPEYLADRLPAYRHPDAFLVGGGSGDVSAFLAKMGELNLQSHSLAPTYKPLAWKDPAYRVQRFRDQGTYDLFFEGLESTKPSWERVAAMRFALSYLSENDGPLMRWLRDDLGWAYSMWDVAASDSFGYYWGLGVSLVTGDQVDAVKAELPARIKAALYDGEALARQYQRRRDEAETYWYQRLGTIVDDATSDLTGYGRIVSEQEYLAFCERCADPAYLLSVWESFDRPDATGWLCAAPLES